MSDGNEGRAAASRIISAGDPVLRTPAAPVGKDLLGSPELDELVQVMIAAMRAAPGVGLAAPQIGVGLQVIVFEDTSERMEHLGDEERRERARVEVPLTCIVNPRLRFEGDAGETFFEGCLSVPGYTALVTRATSVFVDGLTPAGAEVSLHATGWPARILQHECDHLVGTLYVDRMIARSLCTSEQARLRWAGRTLAEIAEALHLE